MFSSTEESSSFIDAWEWKRLCQTCQSLEYLPPGACVNVLVKPFQEPVFQGSRVLTRAYLEETQTGAPSHRRVALVIFRSADWAVVQAAEGPVKVLQSVVSFDGEVPILDCTGPCSAVVAAAKMQDGTVLQVAELFCGGFAGWAQACSVFQGQHVPVHVRWTLDIDPQCADMLRCRATSFREVASLTELDDLPSDCSETFHLCADVNWDWWVRTLGRFPVQVLCVSAPCQPWSRAGTGSGLSSQDGRLLLRAADLAGAHQVPVVLLEQVEYFPKHQQYAEVMRAWAECGYEVMWQHTVNLRDVLPGQRLRHLIVLGRPDAVAPQCIDQGFWAHVRRQSLALAQVMFPLPQDILVSCTPPTDVLSQYMDPWLVPTPPRAGARPQTPVSYRVRGDKDCAGVFMAQYQSQHELPSGMLERQGLHGCLYDGPTGLRFFAGPEIAAIHGATEPIFLTESVKDQMRLLGNAIAVPHAAAALAQACRLMQLPAAPEMVQATHWCLAARLHSQNTVLMPVRGGWILCRHDQVPQVIAAMQTVEPALLQVPRPAAFHVVQLCAEGGGQHTLHVPHAMPVSRLLEAVGLPARHQEQSVENLVPWWKDAGSFALQVPCLPELNCSGFIGGLIGAGFCLVLTQCGAFLLEQSGPRTWSQLLSIFCELDPTSEPDCSLGIFSLMGQRLAGTADFGPCMVALSEDEDIPPFSLSCLAPVLPQLTLQRLEASMCLRAPPERACELWVCFPFQLIEAVGWATEVTGFPPKLHEPIAFCMTPVVDRPLMPPDLLQGQFRQWFFVASLEQAAAKRPADKNIAVEVQLVACRLCEGTCPAVCGCRI